MDDIKNALIVCEMMIDRLQRELLSNGSMLGAVNSSFESMTSDEKAAYNRKRQELTNLLKFKSDLLDAALALMEGGIQGVTATPVTDFTFLD